MPTTTRTAIHQAMSPVRREVAMLPTMLGMRDRIPANRMMEIPLPIPNSVICSPIHMTKEEPAMKEAMMTRAAQTPLVVRMPLVFIST